MNKRLPAGREPREGRRSRSISWSRACVIEPSRIARAGKNRRRHRSAWPLLGWLVLAAGGCGPQWLIEPRTAERLAREDNKPLLIYFKAWDSAQHRNMVLDVFNHPSVKPALKDTINLELELAFFPEYCRRYNVQRPQICVMCTPDGRQVDTPMYVNPVPTPEVFLAWLTRAKAAAKPPPASTSPAK
jgi:hypothetical protein